MRRFALLFVLAVLTFPLMAQDPKRDGMSCIVSHQANWFRGDFLGNSWQGRIMFPVANCWSIGGGTLFEIASFDEIENVEIPFRRLKSVRYDVGFSADVQYLIAKQEELFHSVHLQISAKYSNVGFEGEDIRAKRTIETESGGSTSYSYSLDPENESWKEGWFASTVRLSYVLDQTFIHIEFGIGYDLTRSIKKELLNTPSTLTSSWEEFYQYYPSVTVNPFTDYECGKKLAEVDGLHVFVSFGLNLDKIHL